VHVGRVAAALDDLALLRERRLFIDLVVGAVQVIDVLRDEDAFGVVPWAAADATRALMGVTPGGAKLLR
jgi:hypothetical protein